MISLVLLAWVVARLLAVDWTKAAVLASFFIGLFLSYGHIVGWATGVFSRFSTLMVEITVATTLLFVLAYLAKIVFRTRIALGPMTLALNIVGIFGLVFPAYEIGRYEFVLRGRIDRNLMAPMVESSALFETNALLPDIYYIVLDGYGRADLLEQIYGVDNGPFVRTLERLGFFVATEARSNYIQTDLSLASSLNMQYLGFLAEGMGADSADHTPLDFLIGHSQVVAEVEGAGYQVVTLNSGYRRTQIRGAATSLFEPISAATPLESVFLELSYLRFAIDFGQSIGLPRWYPGYQSHRELVLFEFRELESIVQLPSPKFVFAHIMSPHPPFVFDQDGGPVRHQFAYSAQDGDLYPGTNESYVSGYRDQLLYLNGVVLRLLDTIITQSQTAPLIILQGDHGPGSQLHWESSRDTNLPERSSILYAINLPDSSEGWMRQDLTPVNTFRIVFNEVLGAKFLELDDRSYFSGWRTPYRFAEIGQHGSADIGY